MLASDPTLEVPKKIFAAIAGDAVLSAKIGGRMFDHIPDNEIFPYLKIGPISYKEHGSHTTVGFEADLSISVFSRYSGTKEADEILGDLFRLFDQSQIRWGILITDLGNVTFIRTFKNVFREPGEGEIYQGISKFKLVMGG